MSTIKTILRNKSTKKDELKKHNSLLLQFIFTISNQLKFFEDQVMAYEVALWIKSQKNFIGNKGRQHTKSYEPKKIVNVDLGNNAFGREFSYLHPCVVIYNEFRKVFVVPCTSHPAKRDKDGNLFNENMEGKGGVGGDGFDTTTTILLNEARFIDKTRITSELGTVTDIFYQRMYDRLFGLIFESKSFTIEKLQKLKDEKELELIAANKEIVKLQLQLSVSEVAIKDIPKN